MSDDAHEALCRWLVNVCNFPFDWSTDPVPPEASRRLIEDLWVTKAIADGDGEGDGVRWTVAEEGGWE